ncbi:MAG: fibronectin type III domain-containing protein [Gemmatimonadota bacterium]|nr:MAG: fibronectin type III domain-containing protein [Gemmatimonadota bacterium]
MPGYLGRTKGWIATLMVISLTSCSEESTSPVVDTIAPAAISDLIITDSLGTAITLTWTASGDDNQTGTGAEYDLRQAMWPITEVNWNEADQVAGVPAPEVAGTIQQMTVTGLALGTRYHFAVHVGDEAGNWSSVSNAVAASPYPEAGFGFLVATRDGIFAVDVDASFEFFISGGREVEVKGDRVYTRGISEYDLDGMLVRRIPVPDDIPGYINFAALPGDRFALMSHSLDSIYFIDDAGNRLADLGILEAPDNSLQNLDGIVVGDAFIISDDGNNHLLRVDLNTYEMSVFRDLSNLSGWLGAIAYRHGYYYICQAQKIYRFQESGHLELIAELGPDLYNITAIVVAGGHSFVTLNFAGAIYRVNDATGQVTSFLEGLDYPTDLELIWR